MITRTSRRRILQGIGLGLGSIATSAFVAACGGSAAPAAPPATQAAQPTAAAPAASSPTSAPTKAAEAAPAAPTAKPTTAPAQNAATGGSASGSIRLLTTHGPVMGKFIQVSLDKFQKKYPNVKVSWEDLTASYYDKIGTMAAGGTLPDVVNLRSFDMYDWYRKKALYDVSDMMKADSLSADMYAATIGSCFQGGHYWGLPYDASVDILFYNKDLFDKAGVKYPAKDWTWDKLLEAAKALTIKSGSDTTQYGFAAMPPLSDWQGEAFLLQNGARYVNDERTQFLPDLQPATEAVKWWTDLVVTHHVAPTPAAQSAIDMFTVGKGAMYIGGQWQIPGYREGLKFNWDCNWLPAGPAGQKLETQGGTYIIYSKTKVPDASWAMLKWITSEPDWQASVYGASGYSVPAWKEVEGSFVELTKPPKSLPPANAQVVLDELHQASTGALWPNYWEALKAWTDQISNVLLGKSTPEQATKAAQENANKVITAALASG